MGLQTGIAARPQVVSLLHKEQPSVELYIVLTDNTIYLQMPQILYKDVLACEIQEQSHGGQALARGFAHQNAHLEVDITAREADELERATQWPLPARCGQALITRERQSFFTLMQYPNAGLIAMRPHLRGLITKRHSYLRRKVEMQVLKLNVFCALQKPYCNCQHLRQHTSEKVVMHLHLRHGFLAFHRLALARLLGLSLINCSGSIGFPSSVIQCLQSRDWIPGQSPVCQF